MYSSMLTCVASWLPKALLDSTQFMAFFVLLSVGFAYILLSSLIGAMFGGDDDVGGDVGSDHSEISEHGSPVSVFSPKVVAIFFVGFGAAGTLATHYGCAALGASLWGLTGGAVMGGLFIAGMRALYSQQSDSTIPTSASIGQTATVTIDIARGAVGEVGLTLSGQYMTYHAIADAPLPRNTVVKIISQSGPFVRVAPLEVAV